MDIDRRDFLQQSSLAAGSLLLPNEIMKKSLPKKKLAMVGTGSRGPGTWGKPILQNYGDTVEFVGLCDINPGRVAYAKTFIGANCKTYTDFDLMLTETKPDVVIVTTVDATHHEYIIKALNAGVDVITEKPMTTDEIKVRQILEAERKSGKKVIVAFNYRHNPHATKLKEILSNKRNWGAKATARRRFATVYAL